MTESVLKFAKAFVAGKWHDDFLVRVSNQGKILELNLTPGTVPTRVHEGWLIPGMINAHSHSFQFAMAGLAEHKSKESTNDHFWSWRETMYETLGNMDLSDIQKTAEVAFTQMRANGYTRVVEFHYLYRDREGKKYDPVESLPLAILQAARQAGIEICLVPVYYNQGGFGLGLSPRQQRFLVDGLAEYETYLKRLEPLLEAGESLGCGVHSLRAAKSDEVKEVLSWKLGPAHIHVAEQPQEVKDCLANLGLRPIEWLNREGLLSPNCNLVHATHVTEAELEAVASAGANVVLCPSTEANLGDGLFPLQKYLAIAGRFAIGSDSQLGLNPFEELRWLDYQVRLAQGSRNPLIEPGQDSGQELFTRALRGGYQAAGAADEHLKPNSLLSGLLIDPQHPVLRGKPPERLFSVLVYSGDRSMIQGTIARGVFRKTK